MWRHSGTFNQTHALIDLLFYKISSFSKFDILNHSGLFLVQFAMVDVLASARTAGKILISTLVTHANVFLLDENRSEQFSKMMSRSFRFSCLLCGCFRTFQLLEDYMHLDSWCNRTSCLPIFFLVTREKSLFFDPIKKFFLFQYQFSCFESQNSYLELLELWFTYSIFTEPDSRFWRQ